ncbi:MAG: acyltransferase family protein [Alphaproteobacteria bacterium]|nr:acyltransferase family protein [Alphaproteobacteria bacterium]
MQTNERIYGLDWLRIVVFGLLIFYHTGMFYVSWDWHAKSVHAGPAIEPLMMLTSPWRLGLLFLISGVATRFMRDKMSERRFFAERSSRLLIPLLFCVFVIVPPQSYIEIVEKLGYSGSYWDFYQNYVTGYGGWCQDGDCLIVPTWNHLWFVAYLWAYSIIIAALSPLLSMGWVHALGYGIASRLKGAWLILVPAAFLAVLRLTLFPLFGQTHAFIDDFYLHALYFSLFLFGYGLAKSQTLWSAIIPLRYVALVIGLACYAAIASYASTYADSTPPEALRLAMRVVWALDSWCWMLCALGFARTLPLPDGRARAYLTDAVFPYYIMHQTVIVVFGHTLTKWGLPVSLEAPLLLGVTIGACLITYEIVRRVAILRPLFGLRRMARARAPALQAS